VKEVDGPELSVWSHQPQTPLKSPLVQGGTGFGEQFSTTL